MKFDPGLYSGLTVDLDGDLAAVGSQAGTYGDVALVDVTVPRVKAQAKSNLVGVSSISIKGTQVFAGSTFTTNMALLDFSQPTPVVSSLKPDNLPGGWAGGGWTVNRSLMHLVAGNLTGFNVPFFGVGPNPPTLLANPSTPIFAPGTICLSDITPPQAVVSGILNFGTVGTSSSKTLPLSIQNSGGSQLQLSNITTNGNPHFSAASSALTIGPNGSGSVNVTFTPAGGNGFSGTLSASTNDPNQATISVLLSGTSNPNQPSTIVVAASVAFGSIRAGSSLTKQLAVQNVGSTALLLSSIATTAHFACTTTLNICSVAGLSVNPGATATLNVTFTPDSIASFTGTLTASTNDPANSSVSVALTGAGTEFGFGAPMTLGPAINNYEGQNPQLAAWGSSVYTVWLDQAPPNPFTQSQARR